MRKLFYFLVIVSSGLVTEIVSGDERQNLDVLIIV